MKDTGQIRVPAKQEEHAKGSINEAKIAEQKQKLKEQKKTHKK